MIEPGDGEGRAPEPVDWETARRVARFVAGRDPLADSYLAASLQADFDVLTVRAEDLVEGYTGLRAPGHATARVLDRRDWVESNIASMRSLLDPLMQRFGARMVHNPLAPLSRRVAATEMGGLLGYLAQRVLGQYDLLVPDGPTQTPDALPSDAVYYVGANILSLEKRFAFRPLDFRLWIAIHEVTHRAQFTGVPWMREYFLGLVRQTLDLVDPDPRTMMRAITSAVEEIRAGRNPLDEGGLVGLLASPEQRGVLGQVQALMSVLEGHGNVVMDDLGREYVAGQERMSRVLSQRRKMGGLTGTLHKLLGIEQKMRQYEVGEQFVRGVYEVGGRHAFDAVWRRPENLPTLAELTEPATWLARVDAARRVNLGALDDLAPDARVVVGCSGGADSLALLALACARGFEVHAVYVDHGLRAGTEHDADTVARAAAQFDAGVHVERIEVGLGPNLESRARAACYAALERVRARVDASAILVAHTRDDQAETALLQMLRGAGTSGLAGMPARRGFIRRPLLEIRRRDTHELCARMQLAPVHDPMNDDLHHRRVWLRREVIPRLEGGADRDLVDVLARQAEVLREDDEVLESLAASHAPDDAAALNALPRALARRVIRRWLAAPAPPSIATIDRVLSVARGDARAAELPGGDRVERVRGRLVRVGPTGAIAAPVGLRLPGRARFGAVEIEAWIEHGPPVAWPDGRTRAVCDADLVPTEVVVRGARAGEKFRPLGRSGSKLVHDALAEAGVAAGLRASAPVVAATGAVWVVGYRVDHRVRVTSGTRRFLWLSAEPATP